MIIQIFHTWMSNGIFGRMREIMITNGELNWLYATLVKKQTIDPTYMMVERWLCEITSGRGVIGSGCCLTMIAKSLNPNIKVNKKYFFKGTDFGIEVMKQGNYIGGDEKKGFKIANTDISLREARLKLFSSRRVN